LIINFLNEGMVLFFYKNKEWQIKRSYELTNILYGCNIFLLLYTK
jgi:hypothetical protein